MFKAIGCRPSPSPRHVAVRQFACSSNCAGSKQPTSNPLPSFCNSPVQHGWFEHHWEPGEAHITHVCKPVAKGLDVVVHVRGETATDSAAPRLYQVPVPDVIREDPCSQLPLEQRYLTSQCGPEAVVGRRVVASRGCRCFCGHADRQARGIHRRVRQRSSDTQGQQPHASWRQHQVAGNHECSIGGGSYCPSRHLQQPRSLALARLQVTLPSLHTVHWHT